MVTRRELVRSLAVLAGNSRGFSNSSLLFPHAVGREIVKKSSNPLTRDYHGYSLRDFFADGCEACLVEPNEPLTGRPWVWRTMFWDAFPGVDVALLKAGFHLAYVNVGNTFGCPDALKHFDVFYLAMTEKYGLSTKPALEGLSRGGLSAYRWACANTGKVGCIYGDAPVCDMKSWPGGKGTGRGSLDDWQQAIRVYHFANEREMLNFSGNPIDILEPIAKAHIPIIHVCGDADTTVPEAENTDVVRKRYMDLGGDFVLIVKEGCDHHPHGLADPSPVVNFVLAHCAEGGAAKTALRIAPTPGTVIRLARGQW